MRDNLDRFRRFLRGMTALCDAGTDETEIRVEGGILLRELVASDDWLPQEAGQPHPACYQQYLLYCDVLERFSVVSFVWGPGQRTPVHDHTVWGLIGMLRGAEVARNNNVTQSEVARAEARLPSARDWLLHSLEEITEAVRARGHITMDERMRIRLARPPRR